MNTEYFESAEVSDVGRKRKNNEDACLRIPEWGIFLVADGMGGQAGGDLASEAITTTLQQAFAKADPAENGSFVRRITLFRKATNQASKWIKNFADEKVIGQMGSTIVALIIDPRNPTRAAALHAGDSRLYRYRKDELKQITTDHSAVTALAAKLGVTPDKIPAKYQNELLRAVGLTEAVELERTSVDIASGDLYLICSDGLDKMQSNEQIAKILKDGAKDPIATTAQKLINAANEAGGKDNVTVVLIKVGDLRNAPKLIDPDEEEEDQTLVAPVPPVVEAQTPANYQAHTPMLDSGDVHGDTPHTPTPTAHGENPKSEKDTADKDTADKPPTPLPTSVPAPAPTSASAPAPTPEAVLTPAPAPMPAPKVAMIIPSAKTESKSEKITSEKTTKPEIKPNPTKPGSEPEKEKSFPAGVVVVAVIVVLAVGAGIWFAAGSKSKTAAPAAEIPAKPAVSNSLVVAVAPTPVKPPTPTPTPTPTTNNTAPAVPDQAQAALLEAGRAALKNAQAAFDSHDYNKAATLAAAALQKIPGDATATKLQADAMAQLKLIQDAWRDALTKAQTAFNNKDYKNAAAWATEALKKIPNEQAATKLRDSALQQISAATEQDQKYQAALQAGKDALGKSDFTLAETKAKEALSIRPNDPAAEQIIQQMQVAMDLDSARRFFGQGDYDTVAQICQSHPASADFKQLAADSQAEQKALADAKNRFTAGDYSFVAQIQKQACANKPPFVELLKQAADEQKLLADLSSLKQAGNWQTVTNKLASPAFLAVKNKPSFRALGDWAQSMFEQAQKQKLLQQASVTFEELLVWFNIKDPTDPYIQTAEAKKERRRDGTLTVESRKNAQDTVAWMEDFYGKLGMLDQNDRAKLLKQLKDAIASHN